MGGLPAIISIFFLDPRDWAFEPPIFDSKLMNAVNIFSALPKDLHECLLKLRLLSSHTLIYLMALHMVTVVPYILNDMNLLRGTAVVFSGASFNFV